MKKGFFSKSIIQFLLSITGVILLGSLPYLFFNIPTLLDIQSLLDSGKLNNTMFLRQSVYLRVDDYWYAVESTIHGFRDLPSQMYVDTQGDIHPLFPLFQSLYLKSVLLLFLSLLLSFFASVILTHMIILLFKNKLNKIKFILFVFESLPDLFVILILQLFGLWILNSLNVFYINTAYESFILPIIVLSFLPTIYMTKYLLLAFENEFSSTYVELARGKGLTTFEVLQKHIFRNALASFILHFKTIFWFILSNLLIVEIVTNRGGFLNFVWENCGRNPELLTLGMLFIFVPFYFIMTTFQYFGIRSSLKGGVN